MATTVLNASLTVTISDSVVLNGQTYGNTNTLTVAAIDEVYSRVVEVPTGAFTDVLQLGSTGQGALAAANVKYIRVTNLDNSSSVNLKVFGTDSMVISLQPGKSFILGGGGFDAAKSDDIEYSGATGEGEIPVAHNTAFVISAEAVTTACDIEVFAASI